MRIGEVEQQTGLPRKTIRFYEQKGLLAVERSENSYREYDEGMLTRLKTIAILRRAGISIADLQLWTDGVITTKEMLRKRLHELKDSVDTAADQVKLCQNQLAGSDFASLFDDLQEIVIDDAPDGSEQTTAENEPALLGIDIGTTSISAVILTIPTHRLRGVYTIASGADLPETLPFAKTQDAAGIVNRIDKLIDALLHRCPTICAIGFTGQMHGIIYMDENGKLLSPLYTWEDNRAGEEYDGVVPSTCVRIREKNRLASAAGIRIGCAYRPPAPWKGTAERSETGDDHGLRRLPFDRTKNAALSRDKRSKSWLFHAVAWV